MPPAVAGNERVIEQEDDVRCDLLRERESQRVQDVLVHIYSTYSSLVRPAHAKVTAGGASNGFFRYIRIRT
jgi:hypothetical protein